MSQYSISIGGGNAMPSSQSQSIHLLPSEGGEEYESLNLNDPQEENKEEF